MEVTLSQLEEHKAKMIEQREQVRIQAEANINAFNGAIEADDYWIDVINETEATSDKKKNEGLDMI